MSKPTIEVTVSPAGEIKLQTKGYAGRTCFDAARDIELALGEQLGPAQRTGEFFQCQPSATNHQHERT